jgi:hypothetical protein
MTNDRQFRIQNTELGTQKSEARADCTGLRLCHGSVHATCVLALLLCAGRLAAKNRVAVVYDGDAFRTRDSLVGRLLGIDASEMVATDREQIEVLE